MIFSSSHYLQKCKIGYEQDMICNQIYTETPHYVHNTWLFSVRKGLQILCFLCEKSLFNTGVLIYKKNIR
jgi:hypothetical protein